MRKLTSTMMLECVLILSIIQTAVLATTTKPSTSVTNTPPFSLESSSRKIYNLTNLVYHYYLACGADYICQKRNFRFVKPYNNTYSKIKICPRCKCDRKCAQKGNCCPDIMFAYPYPECVATSLLSTRTNGNFAIAKCPDKASDELKTKCEMNYTTAELMKTPPVTSKQYAHTFRNKFCAECNGVHAYDIWPLDINCGKHADFNFLSTYVDILKLAKERSCSLDFETNDTNNYCTLSKSQDKQDKDRKRCNLTETWDEYDHDIEHACNYKDYRKIFCFMCNPPKVEPSPISACNISGLWTPYDSSLEYSCKQLGYSRSTAPYKNVFCFLCNRNNTSKYSYHDAHVSKQRIKTKRGYYEYTMEIKSFNMDIYHELLKQQERKHIVHNAVDVQEASLNKTKLVMHHFAFYGRQSYCKSDLVADFDFENYTCSCDPFCIFRTKPPFCCIDFLLRNPASCFNNTVSAGRHTQFFKCGAVDKCFATDVNEVTRTRCEQPGYDIFGILPVSYQNTTFKNFDCFMCNIQPKNLEIPYTPWKIKIYCDSGISMRYFLTLQNIIQTAKDKACSVEIEAKNKSANEFRMGEIYCNPQGVVNTCNVSGKWSVYDRDIRIACENPGLFLPQYKGYKNIFCFLCNKQISTSKMPTATKCRKTRYNRRNMKKACKLFPAVPGIPGYKNVFCDVCSAFKKKIPFPYEWIPFLPPINPAGPMRDLFSPVSRPKIQAIEVDAGTKIYDIRNKKIRNLTCYPGKLFAEGTCRPLLTMSTNLRYSLAFALEGKTESPSVSLRKVTAFMKAEIEDTVGKVTFDSFYIKMNLSCKHEDRSHSNRLNDSIGVRILLNTMFRLETAVDRLHTEQKLVRMTEKQYEVNKGLYQAYSSPDAIVLPSLISTTSFVEQCFVTNINSKHIASQKFYRPSLISELLLCHQVVFDIHEVSLDDLKLELSVVNTNRKFKIGEFLLINDTARICVSDFNALYTEKESEIKTALGTTALVCNVISLVCTFFTFITYCLFRAMRSIPGINNMNLVFVMFFAQLLYQFGFTRTSIHPLCVTIGISIHFFWLSTFACMNICSFHMYSVFAYNVIAARLAGRGGKQILKYMLYSYGTPAIIVLLNIIIVFSTSDDGNVGYGHIRCFLNNPISFYLSFLAPVLIICTSNIYFFLRTAFELKNKPKVESTREEKSQYIIYIKLFSLTGITWILLVIDTLFPITVFSFFVTVATACQGLFVFVSFVLNKRVFNYYTDLCGVKKYGEASSTQKSSAGNTQNSEILAPTSL